jgi:hypothetical protein
MASNTGMITWSDGSTGPVSKSFLQRADEAAFWEAWVGAVLSRAGLYTLHNPFVVDGSSSHDKSWDLEVGPDKNDQLEQVEVKAVKLTFTCPDDYPFPRVLVCSQNSWLKKWPGRDYVSRSFLVVSQKTGAILWVPPMTDVRLGVEVTDKSRNNTYKAVDADAACLKTLGDFIEWVEDPNAPYP